MPDMKNVKIAVMQWNKAEIINYKTVFIIADIPRVEIKSDKMTLSVCKFVFP